MTSKPRLGKNTKFSYPPNAILVNECHEYGSRDHLRHPPNPRLPKDFCKSPWGLTTHLAGPGHARRRGLTVFQIFPNGRSSALRRESTERSLLPLKASSTQGKTTLELRYVAGGPLRRESGGSLFEALSEARGGHAGADHEAEHSESQRARETCGQRPHSRRLVTAAAVMPWVPRLGRRPVRKLAAAPRPGRALASRIARPPGSRRRPPLPGPASRHEPGRAHRPQQGGSRA
jgi:hypothetical protein